MAQASSISDRDWNSQWFVCRPRLRQGSTSKMSLRRKSTGWLPSGRVKLNWKLSLWKPWQPRIFLLGNLVNAQTYQGQPEWGSDGWDPHSPNHRSTAKVQIIIDLISIVMSLTHDCCIRVETVVLEVPSRNVGRVIGRRGETVKKKSSFQLALLHLANPYTKILLDLLLICSGEGHQQGEQMQSGRGVRNQGWNC